MSKPLKYDLRGVSADKSDVHAAIKNLDKGLYPNAFCKILPDVVGQDESYCNLMHADTAGTKTSLAYLYWKETGDLNVWKGIVQDALVMNLDDMACVGCVADIVISSTIGRNKHLISGDVISTLIEAAVEFIARMKSFGIDIHLSGGETADVGDIVRTIDVGYTAFARMPRSKLICNDIKVGNVIVGLASYGQATYESAYNGGMGSNGLTAARHDVLQHSYASKYPESFDAAIPNELVYAGQAKLTDLINIGDQQLTLGQLLLSPTRTYLPVIKAFLKQLEGKIDGMIHCTGGAQTKVLKFVKDRHIIKDQLLPLPPLFKIIKEQSGTDWKEMYQVFNMGHRLEVFLDKKYAQQMIDIANSFGIDAQVIGRVEAAKGQRLSLKGHDGNWYQYGVE